MADHGPIELPQGVRRRKPQLHDEGSSDTAAIDASDLASLGWTGKAAQDQVCLLQRLVPCTRHALDQC